MALASLPGQASDLAREKRLSEQIVDAIFDGEPVFLDADGVRFLAIDTPVAGASARGAVIILHGRGFHPDWEDVAHPLRTGLAQHGWHTLSLQMPVLAKEATYFDYLPILPEAFRRIEAGIRYLRERDIDRIIVAAHSCSVHMSMAWAEATGAPGIQGYVGIGMGATDYRQPMEKPFPLHLLSIPVLDVFGSEDYPAVVRNADRRLMAIAGGGNRHSRQIMVRGADHYFSDMGDVLVRVVAGWLDELYGGTTD